MSATTTDDARDPLEGLASCLACMGTVRAVPSADPDGPPLLVAPGWRDRDALGRLGGGWRWTSTAGDDVGHECPTRVPLAWERERERWRRAGRRLRVAITSAAVRDALASARGG